MVSELFLRIFELKEEYFNEFNKHDLCKFHDELKDTTYTSDQLIQLMANYSDTHNLRRLK
jgi:hypothetical protein